MEVHDEYEGRWADLPAEILQGICDAIGPSTKFSNNLYTFAQMRLVCKTWARALPLDGKYGDIYIHRWEEEMERRDFAPNVTAARITAPALTQEASVFHTAALACSNLRSLRLDSVKYEALYDLQYVSKTLEKLIACVLWPKLPDGYSLDQPLRLGWFQWARCLEKLTFLEISPLDNPTYIGIKEIVRSLPTEHLTQLQLSMCVAPCDLKASYFTRFHNLEFLSIRNCNFETSEIRKLQAVLPYLSGIECIQRKARSVKHLLQGKGEPSTSVSCGLSHLRLCLNFSQDESKRFERLRCINTRNQPRELSSKLKSIFIYFSSSPQCILSRFDFSSSALHLESLTVASVFKCLKHAASSGGLCSLRSLTLKYIYFLNYIAPGEGASVIPTSNWQGLASMQQLTELDLNFKAMQQHVIENGPHIFDSLKNLQRLRVESLQGSASILAPVAEMENLYSFELHNCNLKDLQILETILIARRRSLHELEYYLKSHNSCIFEVLVHAVREMPRLKKLAVHKQTPHPMSADSPLQSLPLALAGCKQLVELRVNPIFRPPHRRQGPLPCWNDVAVLTKLRTLSIKIDSGWNIESLAAVCISLIYLQKLTIFDGNAEESIVDADWMAEVARLPLLKELFLDSCFNLLVLIENLKPLEQAPSLMFLDITGLRVQHSYTLAQQIEQGLPNLQKCNCSF